MKRLIFEDMYSWGVFSQDRQIDFNGHLWVRPDGNIIIDSPSQCPMPIEGKLMALGRCRR